MLGREALTRWKAVDLVDRCTRLEKPGITILEPVVGIADVARQLRFHMVDDRAEVGPLQDAWRPCAETWSVEPTWMKSTQSIWVVQAAWSPASGRQREAAT